MHNYDKIKVEIYKTSIFSCLKCSVSYGKYSFNLIFNDEFAFFFCYFLYKMESFLLWIYLNLGITTKESGFCKDSSLTSVLFLVY